MTCLYVTAAVSLQMYFSFVIETTKQHSSITIIIVIIKLENSNHEKRKLSQLCVSVLTIGTHSPNLPSAAKFSSSSRGRGTFSAHAISDVLCVRCGSDGDTEKRQLRWHFLAHVSSPPSSRSQRDSNKNILPWRRGWMILLCRTNLDPAVIYMSPLSLSALCASRRMHNR